MDAGTTPDDNELMSFADEAVGAPAAANDLPPWRILIVDDNEEVHKATEISLRDTVFKGRRFEFVSAYSAQQGSAVLRRATDIALVLLDVVMETQDAGLRLARHIREDLGNRRVQIVLRTGQPGDAPERSVIVDYEINDYKSKSELTGTQLFTLVIAALRAYESLHNEERHHDALAASLSRIKDLESALDQHAIVAATDPKGRITHVNDKLCSISQYTREELLGHDHRTLSSGVHAEAFFKDLWSTITAGDIWAGEICNRAKDGTPYWSAVTIVPFFGSDGRCSQYISIGTDITARKQSEQDLRETEERWHYALEGAGDGVWDVNFDTGNVVFSRRWKQMNGYPEDSPDLRLDGWKSLIHPNDLSQVEADMRAYLAGKTVTYSNEHRTRCQDGSWKWVLDRGMVVKRDPAGKPVRMVGTHTDITERKLAQEKQQSGSGAGAWRTLIDATPVAVCVRRQSDQALLFANEAHARMFAPCVGTTGGQDLEAAIGDKRELVALVLAFGKDVASPPVVLHALGSDGQRRRLTASLYPVNYEGETATIAWFAEVPFTVRSCDRSSDA